MTSVERAALLAAACVILGARAAAPGSVKPSAVTIVPSAAASSDTGWSQPCPRGMLPDGDECVRLPPSEMGGADELVAVASGHHDRRGRWETYEQIPRLPGRPDDYRAYVYPLSLTAPGVAIGSGYDLDRPEAEQRQGRQFSFVGHGGIDLAAPRNAEARAVSFENQDGPAEVVFVGALFGQSVVLRHVVQESGRSREYISLYGHLAGAASGLASGQKVRAGDVIGFVGDSASPGKVHLHFETRRVRDGVDVSKLAPNKLVANDSTIVCDPRNLLPLAKQDDPERGAH